ncbi:BA75_00383T0 [Komagataella pastoris]|uniref:BA75_00383T0 n=1 Tax=Komagataella pastoris TaxID=4922 RepID=A0A1B2J954_PICPA|nr:BA75_00383T0 [Komagataella pastoris]
MSILIIAPPHCANKIQTKMGLFTGSDKDNSDKLSEGGSSTSTNWLDKSLSLAREAKHSLASKIEDVALPGEDGTLFNKNIDTNRPDSIFKAVFGDDFETTFNKVDSLVNAIAPVFDQDVWSELFTGSKLVSSEYGLWAYPIPSHQLYKDCNSKQGLSVWDEHGYWRCLFPKAQLPENYKSIDSNIISKEDVEQDESHNLGRFFTNFSDYLNWRSVMEENIKKERISFSKPQKSSGSSTSYSERTLPNGEIEKIEKKHEWFVDGTERSKETKTIIHPDGSVTTENIK